ncbi:MAG: hypothetical protein L3J33_09070 [Rhodobacteraceae bacterium]|nr:hypothetical protein [Paracoccaceae bacterium]
MTPSIRLWLFRALFLGTALLSIAIPLLPLGFSPDRMAMPDLFLALTIAWVIREPKTAPLVLVAGLALLADAVLMRPFGLWALFVVILSELARMNDRLLRDGGFLIELMFFVISLVVLLLLQNLFLFVTFAGTYPLNVLVEIVITSLICYPFIAMFLHYILRVRGPDSKNLPDRLGKVG